MNHKSIHPDTRIGTVTLRVRDLRRSIDFYTGNMGFKLIAEGHPEARLGAGSAHLLTLHEHPQARNVRGTAGLYHFAILVPSRIELAKSLRQLIIMNTPLQGFADHLVSEAIYLADPDGNGIEIYRDRPREQWPRRNGQLVMATDPLDVNGLLDEVSDNDDTWAGLAPGTTIGHIHLQVSDLNAAVEFYQNTLGLDLVLRYGPSAAFLSAGGYHHHIGLNTWAGTGLPPMPDNATGLIRYSVDLPDQDSYGQLASRIRARSVTVEETEQGLLIQDPSGNSVLLQAHA